MQDSIADQQYLYADSWLRLLKDAGERADQEMNHWGILVVDATPSEDDALLTRLGHAAFRTRQVRSANAALEVIEHDGCDLVVIDGQPLGMSSFELCHEIRRRGVVPVVFLSDETTFTERLLAFDLGADDYISRSTRDEEIERRLRAVLRRTRPASDLRVLPGPCGLRLRLDHRDIQVNDRSITLTSREFDLLRLLLERRGETLSLETVSRHVWGYETMGSRNFIEAHISRLRSKLAAGGAANVITTVRGFGYLIR